MGPAAICLQETFLKKEIINVCGDITVLTKYDIPQSKIDLQTKLQVVAVKATLHRLVGICYLYTPTNDHIDPDKREDLTKQLLKAFILLHDFNIHNTIWGSKEANKKGKITEKLIMNNDLRLLNQKSLIYINPVTEKLSAADLVMCDSTYFEAFHPSKAEAPLARG